jgi:hypothetical protein
MKTESAGLIPLCFVQLFGGCVATILFVLSRDQLQPSISAHLISINLFAHDQRHMHGHVCNYNINVTT